MTTSTPTIPNSVSPASKAGAVSSEVDPRQIQAWLDAGVCLLVDVREPDEFGREHVEQARNLPLSRFDPSQIRPERDQRVVLMCRSGRRSGDALHRCLSGNQAAGARSPGALVSMAGGIEAWKSAGLPVATDRSVPKLGVIQQTQLVIGCLALVGLAIGYWVHPAGLLLPAFMGCGLIVAGFTGLCPLADAIAKLPWNRRSAATCCTTDSSGNRTCK
jgi:rhodanese-related sulfurtransferase